MAILSSDKTSVTVVRGDTLWGIAETYPSYISGSTIQARINTMVALNHINDPDFIVVGQVIKLSGSSTAAPTNNTSRATVRVFGLQSNTDRTMYATWTWTKSNTENYQVIWYYDTGDGVWFIGNDSTTEYKQSTYTAPTNAKKVRFKVKPIAKKHKVNGKETSYWTASWSNIQTYNFVNNPPTTPDVPSVTIDGYKLTATVENIEVGAATSIQFQVVKDDTSVFATGTASIITSTASYACNVTAGSNYKVRCRAYKNKEYSDWTIYTENKTTPPAATKGLTVCRATSSTSVFLKWDAVKSAKTYDLEYTTKKDYFDGSDRVDRVTGIETSQYEKTGLESGQEYFFRIRSVNDQGTSKWSNITSVIVGKKPSPPTTWSSTTTAIVGESLTLYWVHNSEDGSKQSYGEVELYIDDVKETYTVRNPQNGDDEEEERTSSYTIDTSEYVEGTKIKWRVRTAGITNEYGDWSVQRTVDIYAPPTLELRVTDKDNEPLSVLETFPFYISALAGPNTQAPIGYYVEIVANEMYETVDNIGNDKIVKEGDAVYSKHFDITDQLLIELIPDVISLENNISYTITCSVSMDSGLNTEAYSEFTVTWTEEEDWPNAEIAIDMETLTAQIMPISTSDNTTLSVYRREFDGSFTEIITGIESGSYTFATDPHPALDYARYRVVSKDKTTGAISFYDVPGFPVGEKAVVIQWDEDWTYFDPGEEAYELEQPPWSGSMLKLPYNIDVSDNYKPDVSLIEYAGREHPVSYYGTQKGHTSSWKVNIPKTDIETLYALRRLARWMGDVYVREPSGSGYWANITVSFSQTHCEVVIPVSFDVTRVEGGM